MKAKLILLFLINAWLEVCFAQDPYAVHLDRASGLPSVSVYQCFQDKAGFVWFASDVGLTKYDGFNFQTFTSNAQTAFAGSFLQEDKFGRIWYQNFDGFNYYVDQHSGTLRALDQKNSAGYLQYGLSGKYFFYVSLDGIEIFDLKSLKKIKTLATSVIDPQHTCSNGEDFYFIESNNIIRVDETLKQSQVSTPFRNKSTKQIYCLNKDTLVLAQKYNEENLIYFYSHDLRQLSSIVVPKIKLIHCINFIDNKIWISTPQGVYVYSKNGTLISHYFSHLSVSGVFKDRQKNYWFTTVNQGIYIVPQLHNKFLFGKNELPNKIAKIDNEHFLISTKKGKLHKVNSDFEIEATIVDAPEKGDIYFLHYEPSSKVISYTSNGFYQVHINQTPITQIAYAIKALTKIDDKYWAFASSNICGLLMDKQQFHFPSDWDTVVQNTDYENVVPHISNIRTRSVAYDSKNKIIYYATNSGLYKFESNQKTEIKKNGEAVYASKLLFHNETLYVLSTKGSLYEIDKNYSFQLLNKKFNIEEYNVKYCALFDDNLVFASSNFIYQLNLTSRTHFVYNLNISSYDINDILLNNNELYLLINEGIIRTSRNNSSTQPIKPIFKINTLSSKDSTYRENKVLQLDYNNNDLSISYSILDFGNSLSSDLFYKINGGKWQITSKNSRELNLVQLKSGEYKIEFKLGDEILDEKIQFIVFDPWWKRSWFLVLIVVGILILISLIYYLRVQTLSKRNKLLEQNVILEQNLRKSVLTAVKSQMNPHFFYNALNTIQAFIYTNDKENAGKYLLKFSKLTRQVLEMSEKDLVGLDEEIQTIKLYLELEQARFEDDFEYQILVQGIQNPEAIKVPPMLIQPYIENAIKHGLLHKTGQKKLDIEFNIENHLLIVCINDNGIGRSRSMELNRKRNNEHKSFAGEANTKRLELLNYGRTNKLVLEYIDKFDEFGQVNGTQVIIRIPI
jgi:sensor histidine kinase YesM/ligand-binding sensor domain-containing protein